MVTKRRRCALESCRKQYRPKRSDSIFCTGRCRVAAHRQRKAERAENGNVNRVHQGRYAALAHWFAQKREPSVDELPTDEEYMEALMATLLPNGPPEPAPRSAPQSNEPPLKYVTIRSIPTRFPGTPPGRGRQG